MDGRPFCGRYVSELEAPGDRLCGFCGRKLARAETEARDWDAKRECWLYLEAECERDPALAIAAADLLDAFRSMFARASQVERLRRRRASGRAAA